MVTQTAGASGESPPTPIASDYIELGLLVVLFVAGGPLNLAAYAQIKEKSTKSRLDLLKKHLNMSDIMVLFVYGSSRICWLLTYDWRGGDVMCRLVKFLHALSFQISSNVVVVIALDRLCSVLLPTHSLRAVALRRTRCLLGGAWLAAALISAPQIFYWRAFEAFPNWHQCVQIWQIERAALNGTQSALMSDEEQLYTLLHMIFVFWLPCAIVAVCYLTIAVWVFQHSRLFRPAGDEPVGTMRSRSSTGGSAQAESAAKRRADAVALSRQAAALRVASRSDAPRIVVSDENMELVPIKRDSETAAATPNGAAVLTSPEAKLPAQQLKKHRAAIRISFLIVAAYIICWLPYNLMMVWQLVDNAGFHKFGENLYFFHAFMVFNSVINPFLYGMFGVAV